MRRLYADLPDAIINIEEIVDKVEVYDLKRNVLLPKFDIPPTFKTEDEYLKHLTYEGAKRRYPDLTPSIRERLDFELETIKKTGYPGYFLIVQDFTSKAREMGVSVGPGRGSAAGSAVAYCIGITNVDPIAYDLLFERFLNPDRVSLPDIDIDFDDEGRDKVLEYVIGKYGHNQVAQIITYGTMAAKSAIRDCARVMELPLADARDHGRGGACRPQVRRAPASGCSRRFVAKHRHTCVWRDHHARGHDEADTSFNRQGFQHARNAVRQQRGRKCGHVENGLPGTHNANDP